VRELVRGGMRDQLVSCVQKMRTQEAAAPGSGAGAEGGREEEEEEPPLLAPRVGGGGGGGARPRASLEFVKVATHMLALDPACLEEVLVARATLLSLLHARESDALWQDPCLTYTLSDVACRRCHVCSDVDLCRDEHVGGDEEGAGDAGGEGGEDGEGGEGAAARAAAAAGAGARAAEAEAAAREEEAAAAAAEEAGGDEAAVRAARAAVRRRHLGLAKKWRCPSCATPFERAALEARLVADAQRLSLAFQLQDLRCSACRRARSGLHRRACACGRGRYEASVSRADFARATRVFALLARAFGFGALQEAIEALGLDE
jgi:hypothetical protein